MFSNRLKFQKSKSCFLTRFYCNDFNKPAVRSSIQKVEEQKEKSDEINIYRSEAYASVEAKYWSERSAIKREKRANKFPNSIHNTVDFLRFLQSFSNIPLSLSELVQFLRKRYDKKQLIEQKYLPQRVAVLKADLGAAHFIVRRGGSVKFKGNPEWVGIREKVKTLPAAFIPGLFIEGIKAENTSLYCEGLQNLSNLYHLSYLSLRNLETVNDWFLDFISQEYYINLKHLDICGCKNITYRGLSCFYRFEKLQILEVEGIPDTTEFKLACLMLLEIMPHLDVRGIDLSVPSEIEPGSIEDNDKSYIAEHKS